MATKDIHIAIKVLESLFNTKFKLILELIICENKKKKFRLPSIHF